MSQDRLMTLPQWAQERIKVAERRVAEANAKIDTLFGDGRDTDTFVGQSFNKSQPLPKGVTIRFSFGGGRDIRVRVERGRLDINSAESISVEPASSNHVTVGLR